MTTRRRRLAFAVTAVMAITVTLAWHLLSRTTAPPPCSAPARSLVGVWDDSIKAKVHAAFAATKKPYGERAATAVIAALDVYLADLAAATVENCKATRVRDEQSPRIEGIRQLCLDQKFEEARALGEMLQDPTAALVDNADKAVWELDPVTGCANPAVLVQPDIEARYRPDYIRLLLQTARAHAQAIGGQLIAADGALLHAADEGKRIHADDVVALALHGRAAVLFGEGRVDEAYVIANDAVWTATRAHRDDLVVSAALTLAIARQQGAGHLDVADQWVDLANAAAARTYEFSPDFDERRLELIGVIAAQRGDLATAVTSHERALAAAQRLWGKDNPVVWSPEVQLATTLARSGAWVQALPHFQHALRLREAAVGLDHPDVALILSNLAGCYEHAGDSAAALASVKRALQIREKTYGPKSPLLVATLNNLADFELRHHELAGALTDIERAEAIAIRFPGPTTPTYHTVATTRAEVLGAAGRVAESRKLFDEVLALEDANQSPELGTTLAARGTLELAQGRWKDAAQLEERAIAAYEKAGGRDHLSLWKPLAGLAQARRALDKTADVRPLLERALAIGIKGELAADELAPIRAQLAALTPAPRE